MTHDVVAPAGDGIALREDFAPWSFAQLATPAARQDMAAHLDELRARGHAVGDGCVVSRLAAVHPDTLTLGDRSTVAAHAHLTGDLRIGADCSVNVGTAVRGRVTIGDGVRIGSHSSLLGFDHGFADTATPIREQPLTSVGVTVGDDVWIGSHVVVLDGVHVGDHAVVGAGAVVTRDVPAWAVAVGNPARVMRDRRRTAAAPSEDQAIAGRLRDLGARARADVVGLLARGLDERTGRWVDRPGEPATVRAHCDAVEIADLLTGQPPAPWSRAEHVAALGALQSRTDGMVPELAGRTEAAPTVEPTVEPGPFADDASSYHVLAVGYALDLLGAPWPVPLAPVADLTPDAVVRTLASLDLDRDAWGAGHRVDAIGTALTWELRAGRPVPRGAVEALLGWLLVHRDPATGLWGRPGADGLRLPVNGFYRTVRGTFAQWGVALPDHRVVVDALLRHSADPRVYGPGRASACDVLDLVHPLWWLTQHDRGYRWPEIQAVARDHAVRIVDRWADGGGFAFTTSALPGPDHPDGVGLQGTEMWLATLWYAADLLDLSGELGFRPRGVHRPGPAIDPVAAAATDPTLGGARGRR
ncbi:DapH/DapD/GlmU-related protein [uncultured Cellulomonas sp.]|uniref:acyltransferase n=1 Tax=uncultured Cellulomonas sp. TaxID=189682 RepID=UPI00262BFE9E|nr:acyltransferase [uncultured Cellulomonas sp.]